MNDILPSRPKKTIEPAPKIIKPAQPNSAAPNETPVEKPEVNTPVTPSAPGKKKRGFHPIKKFKSLSKKKKILVIVLALIVLLGGSAAAWTVLKSDKPAEQSAAPAEEAPAPKSETEASRLSGVQVKPELNQRPVTGIMIENSPDARPQAGLKDAGVVFEAIAEGGITRFLALFQEGQPDHIGPVRSVRPYYLDWLQGFDAAIAHVGGSSEGLAKIKSDGIKDLDQFANAGAFKRVSNRYAPHNMYTTMGSLDGLQKSKGFTSSKFDGFLRKDDQAVPTPTAKTIDINISSFLYNPKFEYDAASNSYKRLIGGKPHLDEKSGSQITPKVVIAPVISYGIASNRVNSTYKTIGSGKVFIFQDGFATEGTWEKTSTKSQMTFKDAAGNPIKLNAGQTWISVVAGAERVTYKP